MKAHKIIITIKTDEGDKKVQCLAFKYWAYHRNIINSNIMGVNYTVTHIVSGMCLPYHYLPLQKKARILTEMLENMPVQWNGKGDPSKKFEAGCLKVKDKFVADIA